MKRMLLLAVIMSNGCLAQDYLTTLKNFLFSTAKQKEEFNTRWQRKYEYLKYPPANLSNWNYMFAKAAVTTNPKLVEDHYFYSLLFKNKMLKALTEERIIFPNTSEPAQTPLQIAVSREDEACSIDAQCDLCYQARSMTDTLRSIALNDCGKNVDEFPEIRYILTKRRVNNWTK